MSYKINLKSDPRVGSRCKFHKLSDKEVTQIREMYDSGQFKQVELAKMYNVSQVQISNIVNRRHRRDI